MTTATTPKPVAPKTTTETTSTKNSKPGAPQGPLVKRAFEKGSLYAMVLLVVVIMAVPLLWMFMASFKSNTELYSIPLTWLPESFEPGNYISAASQIPILRMFFNSTMVTIIGSVAKVVLALACAYALVFVNVPLRNAMFIVVIFALLIPGQITIIPNYTLISSLGWLNTYQGLIVPAMASAFGTFLLRNHYMSLPNSVFEAAQMDGAGHWRRLWMFAVPMSWPTISAVTLVAAVGEWNDYLWPMLITDRTETMTLPVGLTLLQKVDGMQEWGVLMAATTLVTLPMLLLFLLLQRRLVAGLTAGAVTG